jgi:hypothetical protein
MHPALTYELQKTIAQERLHNAARTQRTRLPRVDDRPRLAAGVRQPSHLRSRFVLGLLGLL